MNLDDIRTGDIVFFRTKFKWYSPISWLSVMIRWIAGVQYNHVGIIVKNWGIPMVNEALGRGMTSTPFKDRIIGKEIKICRADRYIYEDRFAREANSFLGRTPYDFIGLFVHQLLWNTLRIWIGPTNIHDAAIRFYCYEFAAFMHREDYQQWYKVSPKLFEIFYETIYEK